MFNTIQIKPQSDDDPGFANLVENALNGIVFRHGPAAAGLLKLDNWFGSRWLGFSGKALGALSVRHKPYKPPYRLASEIRIPPFIPARVVSQRRFLAPDYREVDWSDLLHRKMPSMLALRRKAVEAAPAELLAWYSGNTAENGRGSLMAYVPIEGKYWAWYVGLERNISWRITESWDIKPDMFFSLVEDVSQGREASSIGAGAGIPPR